MSRALLVGASCVALLATPALAQTTAMPGSSAVGTSQSASAQFVVHFALDSSTLNASAREVVGQAAQAYQHDGQAQVQVIGHTDTSGSASHNLALSKRRAESVERELVRQGVPASSIAVRGEGQEDLAVQTGPGVREARNRRVEISVPQQAMAPVAAAPAAAMPVEPEPMPAAAPPPPPRPMFEMAVGGFAGYNFRETDGDTESNWAGGELSLGYLPTPNFRLRVDQAGFGNFNAVDSGLTGRTVLGADLQANLGAFHPYIGLNVGALYGKGAQDGYIAGPEAGFRLDFSPKTFMYAKAAYDYQGRNTWDNWDDFDRGDVVGGLGVGVRF
jgi:outer membrane protein OmpA-like peptidoglycan-associated protein